MTQVSIKIRELDDSSLAQWDAFVESCEEATFFHRSGWKRVIERSFGHKTHFLYAEQNNKIQAILPLGQINSRLFGHSLISLPFCVYGGVAAKTEEARIPLENAACELANKLGVDHLEMRNQYERSHQSQHVSLDNSSCNQQKWISKDLYVTFKKEIDPDPEVNLLAIPRKQRAMVRKGIKAELKSEIDHTIERLYNVYSESVHNLGTPVFPKKYFEQLKAEFGDACEILIISKEDTVVSGVMSFYFRNEVLPYYGGGNHMARACKANDFMYWELIRRSSEKGIRVFDYGRSKKGTGSYSFKKNWGFEPKPLHYEYHLVKATELPDINPLNPKYQLFIKLWKRMPLALSRFVGPMIAKSLG